MRGREPLPSRASGFWPARAGSGPPLEVGVVLLGIVLLLLGLRGCSGCLAGGIAAQLPPDADERSARRRPRRCAPQYGAKGGEVTAGAARRAPSRSSRSCAARSRPRRRASSSRRASRWWPTRRSTRSRCPGGEVFVLTGLLDAPRATTTCCAACSPTSSGTRCTGTACAGWCAAAVYGIALALMLGGTDDALTHADRRAPRSSTSSATAAPWKRRRTRSASTSCSALHHSPRGAGAFPGEPRVGAGARSSCPPTRTARSGRRRSANARSSR